MKFLSRGLTFSSSLVERLSTLVKSPTVTSTSLSSSHTCGKFQSHESHPTESEQVTKNRREQIHSKNSEDSGPTIKGTAEKLREVEQKRTNHCLPPCILACTSTEQLGEFTPAISLTEKSNSSSSSSLHFWSNLFSFFVGLQACPTETATNRSARIGK